MKKLSLAFFQINFIFHYFAYLLLDTSCKFDDFQDASEEKFCDLNEIIEEMKILKVLEILLINDLEINQPFLMNDYNIKIL